MDGDILATSGAIGIILPLMLSVIIQPSWRSEVKGLVAFMVCAIAGAVVAWLQGDLGSGVDVATAITTVLVVSQTLYATYWRPSGIAPAIERETSAGMRG